MEWKPHITVATVVEDNGRFLMVEEYSGERAVLNQPAGHLDPNETLIEAAIRETLEETGYDVELTGVIGIYLYTAPSNSVTHQRVCFAGKAVKHHPEYTLDTGIIGPQCRPAIRTLHPWAATGAFSGQLPGLGTGHAQ